MSSIEYRNLLYEISREISWLTERHRLLYVCEGFIPEGSETDIHDVLALFKELEKQNNLGIDRLEVLKDILKGTGKWDLLERIEKFEIKRKEFNGLLEHISHVLDESGHLEQLVSICKRLVRIAADREGNIKDVRTLLKELERNNKLGPGQLDILKILIRTDKPDLLPQVEEFEKKRKQEDDAEESKRRRKAQAVAVLSSARYAGERLIGTITPYCTFRNVAGGIVVVTTCMILRRSTSLEEFVNTFTEAVLPAANTLRAISDGSVCFTIQAENSSALEALWKQYQDGTLQKNLQEFLVTDEIRQLAGGDDVTLTVHIDEQEYQNACLDLIVTEKQELNIEESVRPWVRNRRNSDSAVHLPQKEDEMSAVLLKLNQAEIKIKSQQEIIERQQLEEAKFKQITEETSGALPDDPIAMRSAFDWKMERYLENLEVFRDPSEMSDSGVSTQSGSFGLRKENKGRAMYPREDDGNESEEHSSVEKAFLDTRKIETREEEKATYAENLGKRFQSRGDHFQAIRKEIKDRKGEGAAYANLGNAYHSLGDFRKAVEYHEMALMITKEVGDRQAKGAAYANLGNAYHSLGDFRKTVEYHEMALMITKEVGDRQAEGAAYANLGNAYHSLGDFRKTVEYHERALMITNEVGDRQAEGAAYANLGNAYHSLGDVSNAVGYHEMALMIYKEFGDRQAEGAAYGNLGNAYHSFGDFRKAVEYHERAIMIYKEFGDRQAEGAAYGNLGNAYHSFGDFRKAVEYHERALIITKEVGDRRAEGAAYGNLGNVFHSFGDFRKAVEYHERALITTKEVGDRQAEGAAYGNLGNAFHSLGDFRKAMEYHERALMIYKEFGDRQAEGAAYLNLGNVFHSLGDYGKAVEYHERGWHR